MLFRSNPEEYYTKEILQQLDEAAKKEFTYGLDEDQDMNAIMDTIEEEQELQDADV